MARQPEEKTPPGTTPDILSTSHFTAVSGLRYYIVEKTLVVTAKHGGKDGVFIAKWVNFMAVFSLCVLLFSRLRGNVRAPTARQHCSQHTCGSKLNVVEC